MSRKVSAPLRNTNSTNGIFHRNWSHCSMPSQPPIRKKRKGSIFLHSNFAICYFPCNFWPLSTFQTLSPFYKHYHLSKTFSSYTMSCINIPQKSKKLWFTVRSSPLRRVNPNLMCYLSSQADPQWKLIVCICLIIFSSTCQIVSSVFKWISGFHFQCFLIPIFVCCLQVFLKS